MNSDPEDGNSPNNQINNSEENFSSDDDVETDVDEIVWLRDSIFAVSSYTQGVYKDKY